MVGDIFDLNNQILEILENNNIGTIERIQLLLDKGLVDEGVFPKAFIAIINKYDDEPETIHMVLSGGTSVRYIEPLSGHDQATISRYRGGIIASTIKGISRYENAIHLIMP